MLLPTVQDIVFQLQRLVSAMTTYLSDCHKQMKQTDVFPIEVDLLRTTTDYNRTSQFNDGVDEEDDDEETNTATEAAEDTIVDTS